jgi:hypothetical protein
MMTMADLSLTRKDILTRAAQAAYNAESSSDIDTSIAWAEVAHAWVAVSKEMGGYSPSSVTIELDEIVIADADAEK